jgi:type III restriction enzyme
MNAYWIPGVNNLKSYGRWAFAELRDVYTLESDLATKLREELDKMLVPQRKQD